MKYTLTGSTGHISKPLAEHLLKEGHEVTLISSDKKKTEEIEALGAKAAIGSVEDTHFLTRTFEGSDGIYTMVPPNPGAADWKGFIHQIGKNYAHAIKHSGVKKVVNLSSLGAHLPKGAGPVSGLYFVEQELDQIEGVDILHLRPGYFYYNLLANIGMIKHMGFLGSNTGESPMVMVHPRDIAWVAFEALNYLGFTGKSIKNIASDERSSTEVAHILGEAIGKPELPWISFTNEDTLKGMLQAGLPQEAANNYVEMGACIASGQFYSDYFAHKPHLSPTKIEDFAQEFAEIYAHS
jgi:uncharacterized protein YbjT (DUF2867 family)